MGKTVPSGSPLLTAQRLRCVRHRDSCICRSPGEAASRFCKARLAPGADFLGALHGHPWKETRRVSAEASDAHALTAGVTTRPDYTTSAHQLLCPQVSHVCLPGFIVMGSVQRRAVSASP